MSKKINILVIVLLLFYFIVIWPRLDSSTNLDYTSPLISGSVEEESTKNSDTSNNGSSTNNINQSNMIENADATEEIIVDLRGAVHKPGIYHLPVDSRIYELIEKAGGFDNANISCINQAEKLVDESYIYIPSINEECEDLSTSQNESTTNLININEASVSELSTLPGIGETKAQDIVNYRDTNGPFTSIEGLTDVSGIGEATLANISTLISI